MADYMTVRHSHQGLMANITLLTLSDSHASPHQRAQPLLPASHAFAIDS